MKIGEATVKFHDECYINRSKEEIADSIENLKKICTRIAIHKCIEDKLRE